MIPTKKREIIILLLITYELRFLPWLTEHVLSQKGGYVLKKLIKKTTLLAHFLNIDAQQLIKISRKLIEINSSYHTHLKEEDKSIISELEREINKYRQFISSSIQELDKNYSPKITAENIFFWYDTKGIPQELIRFCLPKKKFIFPEKEFKNLLEKQKEKGRQDREKKKISTF